LFKVSDPFAYRGFDFALRFQQNLPCG
jgi:hypothetical protein